MLSERDDETKDRVRKVILIRPKLFSPTKRSSAAETHLARDAARARARAHSPGIK